MKKIKLGDSIARLTKLLRISHCAACEERRLILNDIQEIGLREAVSRLTDCCKE